MDTDASDYGIGGVLSQCIEGTEHVIAYYSKSLNPAQQEYCTTRRELLAVVATLDHLRMGPEVCGTNGPRRTSLVEKPEEHSRDVGALVGKVTTVSLRNHT